MPWNGTGTYTRAYASWTNDANLGSPISATKFDLEDNDFQAGIQNCLTIDGQNKPSATLNWAHALNISLGSDGQAASWSRSGGSNNPALTLTVADATGITMAMAGGTLAITGARGVPLCAFKAVTTQRTGTIANDPDLTIAVPKAGTYAIEITMVINRNSGSNATVIEANFSGSLNGSAGNSLTQLGTVNGAASPGTMNINSPVSGFLWGTATLDVFILKGSLQCTSSGTLVLQWGQSVSSANPVNLFAGSTMTITQIS